MIDYITTYVIGPTPGGVQISHGALFVLAAWVLWSYTKRFMLRRANRGS